jgi:16S rRNA (cytidine1402-2'-O)-methyltransferase
VVPVPGASAVLSALVASGLPTVPFTFVGFLPRKAGLRDRLLVQLGERRETLVFFESPQRVAATLRVLADRLGAERPACVAREVTKLHEEFARGSLAELAERFAGGARGEIAIVVGGADATEPRPIADPTQRIAALADRGLRAREIASELARELGIPRRDAYARVLAALGKSG